MSTLSEFMARRAPRGKARAEPRAPSTSPAPVVVLKGWRKGIDKAGVTLLLRNSGVPLSEAYDATNAVLAGMTATVRLPSGADAAEISRQLEKLGVVV